MKYRKKPVVIEAIQWTNNNLDEVLEFAYERSIVVNGELFLETLEGRMKANVGDFLIKGIKGEFYPCKPDIFEQTYDLVDDVESDERDCTTCKNAYIKDGVYLICDIDGIQNDVVKDCENYESEDDNA